MACVICKDADRGRPDVYFSPCSHKACESCVQKLRVANVYKADKGAKCPICKQLITAYLDKPPVVEPEVELSSPTNYGRGGISSWGDGNDYIFARVTTGTENLVRMGPRPEDTIPGYVVPPLRDNSDVLAMAMDKTGARHLDYMLREGHPQREKAGNRCRQVLPHFSTKLATHPYGNFVFQRMTEYAHATKNRAFFTAIVRGLCRDGGLAHVARDVFGCYCVQKILCLLRGTEELRLVMKCLSGSVVSLCLHQQGVYCIERLVENLIGSLKPGSLECRFPQKEAAEALIQLVSEVTTHVEAIGSHQVSGTMFVECIRWTLPDKRALNAGITIAKYAKQLMKLRNSNRTLQGLLSLEVKQIAEELIDSLKGEFLALALDQQFYGPKLVRACFATRCVDEETRLSILQELLDHDSEDAWTLINTNVGGNLLSFGLAILSGRNLEAYLSYISDHFGLGKYRKIYINVLGVRKWLGFETVNETKDDETGRDKSPRTDISDPWGHDEPTAPPLNRQTSSSSCESSDTWESAAASLSPEAVISIPNATSYTPPHRRSQTSVPSASSRTDESTGAQIRNEAKNDIKPVPRHREKAEDDENNFPRQPQFRVPVDTGNNVQQVPQLRVPVVCLVCGREQANAVLLDCSHMSCCVVCAYLSTHCPVCKQPIRDVVQMQPVYREPLIKPIGPPSRPISRDVCDLLPPCLRQEMGIPRPSAPGANDFKDLGNASLELNMLRITSTAINKFEGPEYRRPRQPYRPPDLDLPQTIRPYRPPDVIFDF